MAIGVTALAVISLAVHGMTLFEDPCAQAASAVADLTSKGIVLSDSQRMDLQAGIHAALTMNRVVDLVLGALLLAGVLVAWLQRWGWAISCFAMYATLNTLFLFVTWGVIDHPVINLTHSFLAQARLFLQKEELLSLITHLSRPTTLICGYAILTLTLLGNLSSRETTE